MQSTGNFGLWILSFQKTFLRYFAVDITQCLLYCLKCTLHFTYARPFAVIPTDYSDMPSLHQQNAVDERRPCQMSPTGGHDSEPFSYCYYCVFLIVCLCMSTLTEVFPCFFLSSKANARVKPPKTGHG
jgi:hypothetical protein